MAAIRLLLYNSKIFFKKTVSIQSIETRCARRDTDIEAIHHSCVQLGVVPSVALVSMSVSLCVRVMFLYFAYHRVASLHYFLFLIFRHKCHSFWILQSDNSVDNDQTTFVSMQRFTVCKHSKFVKIQSS